MAPHPRLTTETPLSGSTIDWPFFPPLQRIPLAFSPPYRSHNLRFLSCLCLVPFSLISLRLSLLGITMSATGTFRGTPNKTIGRGRLPDFGNDPGASSHIPRPKPDSSATTHNNPSSDIGSGTMSAASSRQRQNQSKRDEVRHDCKPRCCLFTLGLQLTS